MVQLRRRIKKYKRGLWVFAAVVCLMQMVPLHIHLHHSEDTEYAATSHAMDMHIADSVIDHQHHGNAHIIDLGSETVANKLLGGDSLMPLLFLFLLTVYFISATRRLLYLSESSDRPPQHLYLIASPPRAPPRT